MSKVTLTFNSIPQWTDTVTVTINNGVDDIPRSMSAVQNRVAYGQYEIDQAITDPLFWAGNFVVAWNIDNKDLGGIDNLKATVIDSGVVEINVLNDQWQFVSATGTSITSGRMSEVIVNDPIPLVKRFDHALTGADCADADYSITINGGTPPYAITGTPISYSNVTSPSTFKLQRGTPANVTVTDSLGDLIQTKSITPPRNIKTGNFTITVTPVVGSNTATVEPNIVLTSDILPIEYSLDGVTYTEVGSFPGLAFEDTFTMYIKDAFGCVITKDFVTLTDNGSTIEQQYLRYAKISNAGTLIFSEHTTFTNQIKKNPSNTLSCQELTSLPYEYTHDFDSSDVIVQQFKSSYGYHKITLITNGVSKYIEPILQYENLNQKEKVDASIFRTVGGKLGLYFDGGANYIPDTTTVDTTTPSSLYNASNLPSWSKVGQEISIDGIGAKTVNRISTDSSRGLYLEFDEGYTSLLDVDVLVQANYNRQNYNLYEFALPMSSVNIDGRVIIEMGFNDLVERTFVSELIKEVTDDEKRLLIKWSDPENKAGVVHQTGITHFARLYGALNHKTVSTSELYSGDSEAFNLDQRTYITADFNCLVFGFGMENKLAMASGMENFTINGFEYKKESWDSETLGSSNTRDIKGVLQLGGNDLEVNADEIVLQEPSTPLTAKPSIPATIPNMLALDVDSLVLNGDGGFIQIGNG